MWGCEGRDLGATEKNQGCCWGGHRKQREGKKCPSFSLPPALLCSARAREPMNCDSLRYRAGQNGGRKQNDI